MKHDTITVGTMKMDYCCFGSGERTMAVIPGISLRKVTGLGMVLSKRFGRFTNEFTVYVFDRKDEIEEGYMTEDIAEDTVLAMKALGLGRSCIIGYSQGGMIAQVIGIRHPEMIDRIMLGATMARQNETALEAIGGWLRMAKAGELINLVDDMVSRLYTEELIRKNHLYEFFRSNLPDQKDLNRFICMAEAGLQFDVYDQLNSISAPVLVQGAWEDRVVTAEASKEIAEKLGCELVLYKGYQHAVFDESDAFLQKTYDFFVSQ